MIGIIGAMDKELFLYFHEMTIEKTDIFGDKTFYIGTLHGHRVVVAKSGIGKVNAAITATVMIQNYHVRMILNTGIAGGLSPVKTGDIVLAEGIAYFDVSLTEIDDIPYGQMADDPLIVKTDPKLLAKGKSVCDKLGYECLQGNLVSGDKFVTKIGDLKRIMRHVDRILGVEMEGMAIALTAYKFKVPFISIRGVSDVIDTEEQTEEYHNASLEVANKTTRFVFQFLEGLNE
ncbi:MAG: 5'-methylthioadenosine/adenosylhomocysteine nucleosidase [Bacilli bacterium]|nr:5'-methylthioadenosine/adenosylhomocysteine nucleosidase [Bacilli bacterium]MBN2876812.1 5'-methylthioadenosine/adenosylhomocysteine nucleosidase [Bacilli bacterium]